MTDVYAHWTEEELEDPEERTIIDLPADEETVLTEDEAPAYYRFTAPEAGDYQLVYTAEGYTELSSKCLRERDWE
jgi:hypothetical protein